MTRVASVSNPDYVASQYRTPDNLDIRIRMHRTYSTNAYGWYRWLFDQISDRVSGRVLELGCGTAAFWKENRERGLIGAAVHLTDLSSGMARQALESLGGEAPFIGHVADAQAIPYRSRSFDAVLANHMLYHVPDKQRALAEIRRVLEPDGLLCAATIGEAHLREIADLVRRFDPNLVWWGAQMSDTFTLENGAEILGPWFGDIEVRRYEDAFRVTDADDLIAYILSGRLELDADGTAEFRSFVRREFEKVAGVFHITKSSGAFLARPGHRGG